MIFRLARSVARGDIRGLLKLFAQAPVGAGIRRLCGEIQDIVICLMDGALTGGGTALWAYTVCTLGADLVDQLWCDYE